MINILGLPSEDVAIAFGHTNGGELVRRLYGHRVRDMTLDRVTAAHGRRHWGMSAESVEDSQLRLI